MKCISVYTDNFEMFSDIFDAVVESKLSENEEKEVEGITVSHSGDVPEHYLDRMSVKPEVVVMKDKSRGLMILQHGKVFEILIPELESASI
ncbi:NAD/NADP transhydrogenase alpha subunit [Paenibacillus cellulositrophicus]|uniref:NAD/NADP transhydrogenase alpha subunit n=1 Tax=Paenibacillus cellulositrophicus TaxID=562959 RepID=UPI00203AB8D6|nr:NAD/NADP transhydrogenase alpha subunit [Paenibacillus cellulositrophicus]MCM2999261.1 NAD/NADP transhydrogenase alpha subunit [Paenibacillus cellulositrophicus]